MAKLLLTDLQVKIAEPAVHEQKLNLLRTHMTELNRRMVALMEASEKGFQTHSNLQRRNLPQSADNQLLWLHRQNNLLNQELGDKTSQIEELRKEKKNYDRNRPSSTGQAGLREQHVAASPVKVSDTLM